MTRLLLSAGPLELVHVMYHAPPASVVFVAAATDLNRFEDAWEDVALFDEEAVAANRTHRVVEYS